MEIMGLQIQRVAVREEFRQLLREPLAVLIFDADIYSHDVLFFLLLRRFDLAVLDRRPASTLQDGRRKLEALSDAPAVGGIRFQKVAHLSLLDLLRHRRHRANDISDETSSLVLTH